MRVKMLLMEGSTLYKAHTKTSENDLHKLWVNDYGHNICLVIG